MLKEKKEKIVKSLNELFLSAKGIVITHYLGLDSLEVTDLRRKMIETGVKFQVTKNSLAKLALKNTPYELLEEYLKGPTAIASSEDPIAAIKVVSQYSSGNKKLKIIQGSIENKLVSALEMETMAKLPSLEELRSGVVSYILSPHQQLINILSTPSSELVRVMEVFGSKNSN